MNNRKLLSVSLTILLAVALLALVAPAVSAQDQGEGNIVSSLELVDGEAQTGEVQTYNSILQNSDGEVGTNAGHTVNVSLEPASITSGPGGLNEFDVVLSGATEGVASYSNIVLEIEDPSVAQFTDFTEVEGGLSQSSGLNSTGDPINISKTSASGLELQKVFGGSPLGGAEEITLATVEIAANGSIGDTTVVAQPGFGSGEPNVGNESNDPYPIGDLSGSSLEISFDMSLEFPDPDVNTDNVVTVENVDSDGAEAALILTYENDAGELVIAGLQTGVFEGENVDVTIENDSGLSSVGDENPSGVHTAHIVPVAGLSNPGYGINDTVSGETASAILDSESANVTIQDIVPVDGFGVRVGPNGDLSIGDDYPRNQRDAFLTASDLYGESPLELPDDAARPEDERFLPFASGSHVGPTGLPIQDEIYQWFNVSDDYQDDFLDVRDGTLLGFQSAAAGNAPSQTVAVGIATDDDFAEVNNTVRLEYDEAASHGLEIAPSLGASDIIAGESNITLDPSDVTIDRDSSEVTLTFDDSDITGEDPVVNFELSYVAADPVEGLDVPGTIDYETDYNIVQEVRLAGEDEFVDSTDQANFVTYETGATALTDSAAEVSDFLNESVSETSLLAGIDNDTAVDGEANPGSFLVRQGQIVTLEGDQGGSIDVFEVATTTNAEGEQVYTLGENVAGNDTAPGRVANLDTSTLDANERYFVTFGDDEEQAAVLDVRPLNLDASPETETIGFNEQDSPFEVEVESDDSTDDAFIETWFHFNGTQIKDVVHVERETLTGTGDRDVTIDPALDLAGPGDYTVTVLHSESGVTEQFEFEIADEPDAPAGTVFEADDVNILSPDLFNVTEPSLFDRGDIIPIELELIGGNAATVTFGDLEDQNIEIHATVFDRTYDAQDAADEENTRVTVYLNTYQIGQGYVENASADTLDLQPNRPTWITPGNFTNRAHGFFTNPADDAELLDASDLPRSQNAYATNTTGGGIDIYGGSQGGAVLSPGEEGPDGEFPGLRYDLHVAGDLSPYTAIGEDREDGRDDVNALDIEQRSTDEFNFWTAPGDGLNELAVGDALDTKVGEIQSLIDAGTLTELDTNIDENGNVTFTDSVAEDDFIVVQAQSTGLEGVMHEGVLREGLSVAEFLDRSEDHVYTDAFTNTTSKLLPRDIPGEPNDSGSDDPLDVPNDRLIDFEFDLIENSSSYEARLADTEENVGADTPPRIDDPDLDLEAVIAGENSDGNLAEYFFPYRLDEELPVESGADTVTPNLTFDANTTLEPRGGEQQLEGTTYEGNRSVPRDVNPYLSTGSLGLNESNELDYVQRSVAIDPVHVGPAGLEVPTEESYTITGTSTMAPSTELELSLLSRTGEGTPFAKEQLNIETVEGEGAAPATWEVTIDFANTRDGVSIQPGTTFTADIGVVGGDRPLGGADPTTGFFTNGEVLADPAIENFSFADQQRSSGDVVTIEAFDANRVAQITLVDENGTELGTSGELDRGLQEQFNIVLDEQLEENTEVTATATIVKPEAGEVFPDGERTAEVLVEDQQGAFFDVSDLSPTNGQVEQGTTVTAEATVENLGDLEGTQSVTFSVVGTEISVSETVTLASNESTTVSFDLPTGDVPANDYTHQIASENDTVSGGLTVQAPPAPAAFEIVSLVPAEASVTQGEELVVDVSVTNTGEQEGTQDVVLSVSGLGEVGSQSLTLAGGEADSVSFPVDTTDVEAGDYTHSVSVGDASAEGSLTITAPEPAAFEIVNLSPTDASVTQGDELVVDVSVTNAGEQEGTQEVVLSVSGLGDVGNQSLTLAGGEADSVSFTVDTTDVEAGDYTHSVSVGDASAEGSLTIMEPASPDDSADNNTDNDTDNASSDDGSGPGFGIVVAALALLGAALLAMRRQVE